MNEQWVVNPRYRSVAGCQWGCKRGPLKLHKPSFTFSGIFSASSVATTSKKLPDKGLLCCGVCNCISKTNNLSFTSVLFLFSQTWIMFLNHSFHNCWRIRILWILWTEMLLHCTYTNRKIIKVKLKVSSFVMFVKVDFHSEMKMRCSCSWR